MGWECIYHIDYLPCFVSSLGHWPVWEGGGLGATVMFVTSKKLGQLQPVRSLRPKGVYIVNGAPVVLDMG